MGKGPIRLNLGCGKKRWRGFVNVDISEKVKPDVVTDLKKLPFEDGYADEIHAIHVIEHFYIWEVEDILKEWKRVLKPGGKIFLEMPCMEKLISNLNKAVTNGGKADLRLTWWGFYGDPGYKDPYMCHHWCYSTNMIDGILKAVGFQNIQISEPLFHIPARDMRVTAEK